MHRLVVAALVLAACGSTTDDRPQTLPYITEAILRPTCGVTQCHSQFRQELGYVFDTVASARESIVGLNLVTIPDDQAMPDQSRLLRSIEVGLPSVLSPGSGNVRMPYDAPMPNEDVELMRMWIRSGASGAQCLPGIDVCEAKEVHACDSDGNLDVVPIQTCSGNCLNGACQ
jgi:hypothetical protein